MTRRRIFVKEAAPQGSSQALLKRRSSGTVYNRKAMSCLQRKQTYFPASIPDLLDIATYFDLLGARSPSSEDGMLRALTEPGLIKPQDNGRYSITNLGALLIAKKLSRFPSLRKRILRVVKFEGNANRSSENHAGLLPPDRCSPASASASKPRLSTCSSVCTVIFPNLS